MRRISSIILGATLIAPQTFATPRQTAAPPTPTISVQPTTLLQESLTALVGNNSLTDITLSGTARRIAGADDETGTVTLKAVSNGSARLDLTLAAGPSSEVSNLFSTPA